LALGAMVLALPGAASAANLRGKVELRDSRDPAVRKRLDFSGVVVWMESAAKPPAGPARRARMIQKDKTFSPHVLPVLVGTVIDFPNLDPIFHNAFSNYDGQLFDVGLYPPGTSRSVRFARPGVVRVFCNIHAAMSAVIVVVDTPDFTSSAADGSWEIPNLPPGEYTLHVFHERATPATLEALTRRVAIGAGNQALPAISISESGYLAIPHKNKFGREYPPVPDDRSVYPAVRKE
jgi:plastocyanin